MFHRSNHNTHFINSSQIFIQHLRKVFLKEKPQNKGSNWISTKNLFIVSQYCVEIGRSGWLSVLTEKGNWICIGFQLSGIYHFGTLAHRAWTKNRRDYSERFGAFWTIHFSIFILIYIFSTFSIVTSYEISFPLFFVVLCFVRCVFKWINLTHKISYSCHCAALTQ